MKLSQFDLPHNMSWLTTGDQSVFPVYAASGGLRNDSIRYLIKEGQGSMPLSLVRADLGFPELGRLFSVVLHDQGWKHAAIWDRCDVQSFQACLRELNA